ncbi:unnamed protein product [Candidula unifasciata]|uniref:Cis-aconitate decarboxylase n=1 Tax=Candidula unifasciata TaxID=100452 RepID=A0A8S3ZQM9_9EUPU|nr:unnamed protein product [Candidula unifasciata]
MTPRATNPVKACTDVAKSIQCLTARSPRFPSSQDSNTGEVRPAAGSGKSTINKIIKNDYSTSPEDRPVNSQEKRFAHTVALPATKSLPATSVTSWIADLISKTSIRDLSNTTVHRSKRMLLDTLGVGILGHNTDIVQTVARTCMVLEHAAYVGGRNGMGGCVLWGSRNMRTSPATAAYINGASVHSMDFDDTWHPATHPSGPTLPALLALSETMSNLSPSLEDLLVAYNVGIQVQGLLLRSSNSAKSIPWRFHPPAVVGVMGSAAACSSLLGLGPEKCRAALGIAASFAGAPMANAGTTTKPLHAGKAARFGLEAALLADQGIEGNDNILDMPSGFGAFYDDFDPETLIAEHYNSPEFLLHYQDIALKRFPAHLGMHWTIDAALAVRSNLEGNAGALNVDSIEKVVIKAPQSKYINRPLPATRHEARHSFQFNACTALLDGEVTPSSYHSNHRQRAQLMALLQKTEVQTSDDNKPSFNDMYVEVHIHLKDGSQVCGRCDTPYGHWRNPLSDADVIKKFNTNTAALTNQSQQEILKKVRNMDSSEKATDLAKLLYSY